MKDQAAVSSWTNASGATSNPAFWFALPALAVPRSGGSPAQTVEPASYKISSNESPYQPLPSVLEAIARAARRANRYPDPMASELVEAIARHLDVPREHVSVGAGSAALLSHLVQTSCGAGDEIVHAWRSYELYPLLAQFAGAGSIAVPLTPDGRQDLPALAEAVTARTRLVLLCSPNNPTGTAIGPEALRRFLDRVPRSVTVVLDEAYHEFTGAADRSDGVAAYRDRSNVIVLRTFSKAYGLAGLRVGYAIGHPELIENLRRTAIPFAVSEIGQQAALASLYDQEGLAARVAVLNAERDRVSHSLWEQGWTIPRTRANFVWLPLGGRTTAFAEACGRAGIGVRSFSGEGARCTIAESAANDRLLTVSADFVPSRPGSPGDLVGPVAR